MSVCSSIFVLFHVLALNYEHLPLSAISNPPHVLGKNLPYEQVTVSTFLELLGLQDDTVKLKHFEAVTMDQQEGLLAGTDNIGTSIIGRPLTTMEQFLTENRSQFFLPYLK
jgi:NAD(P)H dehydrogenase (quinone)